MNPSGWFLLLWLWTGEPEAILFPDPYSCEIALQRAIREDNYGASPQSLFYGPPHYMHAWCEEKRLSDPIDDSWKACHAPYPDSCWGPAYMFMEKMY